MLLSDIKSTFHSKLRPLYSSQEINNFFNLTAEYLLSYSKIQIHQNLYNNISPTIEKQTMQILNRLVTAEPIQYVLGKTKFYGLNLTADKRALIPRPETELLVDMLIRDLKEKNHLQMLDIGTGSGCIAIALAKSFPNAVVTAIDKSFKALELAKNNAQLNSAKINFIHDDILNPEKDYTIFDIIISNPPYIRDSERKFMHRNILEFEPSDALFVSDDDPMIFYRAIAKFAQNHLSPQGILYLELNEFLGRETDKVFSESGFKNVVLHTDLNNKCRFLTARK